MKYIIEFRSGTYFQNLKADHGGPKETAQRFDTKEEAEKIIGEYFMFAGGMAVEVVQ